MVQQQKAPDSIAVEGFYGPHHKHGEKAQSMSTGKMDVIRYAIKINNLASNWARLMT